MVAGTNPGGAEHLKTYWSTGPGGVKIRWGTPGDWDRCVRLVTEATKGSMSLSNVKGFCSNLHVRATGARPGQAPAEKAAHKGKG